jgi:hypothetical protein
MDFSGLYKMSFLKKTKKNDLGIKIVSAECALWTKIKDARVATIKQYEEALIVEKEFLKLAERKISELSSN